MTPELCRAIHVYLASSRAWIVMANLDDMIGEVTQMNLPGTLDAYPNWSRKLSLSLEELQRDERVQMLAAAVRLSVPCRRLIGRGFCAVRDRDEQPGTSRPRHRRVLVPPHRGDGMDVPAQCGGGIRIRAADSARGDPSQSPPHDRYAWVVHLVTFIGLLQPGKKRERFTAVVFNRTMVVCVLVGVAYIGVTWEERKAREEAARAALATQTEHLLRANTQLVEIKDTLARSERLAALGQLVASVAHEVGTPLHSIAWHVEALAEEPGVTAEMRKRIGIIDEQLNRVVRIIQDL